MHAGTKWWWRFLSNRPCSKCSPVDCNRVQRLSCLWCSSHRASTSSSPSLTSEWVEWAWLQCIRRWECLEVPAYFRLELFPFLFVPFPVRAISIYSLFHLQHTCFYYINSCCKDSWAGLGLQAGSFLSAIAIDFTVMVWLMAISMYHVRIIYAITGNGHSWKYNLKCLQKRLSCMSVEW